MIKKYINFQVLNKLLHRDKGRQFPPHDSLDHLTNKFANFFVKKIYMIRSQLHTIADVSIGVEIFR